MTYAMPNLAAFVMFMMCPSDGGYRDILTHSLPKVLP